MVLVVVVVVEVVVIVEEALENWFLLELIKIGVRCGGAWGCGCGCGGGGTGGWGCGRAIFVFLCGLGSVSWGYSFGSFPLLSMLPFKKEELQKNWSLGHSYSLL